MKQKDHGVIQKLLALILLFWAAACWSIMLSVMKAGYTSRYLEDCLTQANLAALIVDPYHYGSTGELVFANLDEAKETFEEALEKGLGSNETRQRLGLTGEAELVDFRIYEVTSQGISEFIYDRDNHYSTVLYADGQSVEAPDGTHIQNSAIYARIAVPVEFMFGIEVTAVKEHCVDIICEETKNEEK